MLLLWLMDLCGALLVGCVRRNCKDGGGKQSCSSCAACYHQHQKTVHPGGSSWFLFNAYFIDPQTAVPHSLRTTVHQAVWIPASQTFPLESWGPASASLIRILVLMPQGSASKVQHQPEGNPSSEIISRFWKLPLQIFRF